MRELQQRTESNEVIVRRYIEGCFDEDYRELVDEYIADEFVGYVTGAPEPDRGPDELKQTLEMFRSAFSDITSGVQDICVDGDTVATRWVFSGTHTGEFQGIEPTGNTVEVEGMEFNKLEDGCIVEGRIVWDVLGLLGQLGALPDESGA